MMKKRKKKEAQGIDFWQPTSDMMTAMFVMLLLIILLLMLYLMWVPDNQEIDPDKGDSYAQEEDNQDDRDDTGNAEEEKEEKEQEDEREIVQNDAGGGKDGDGPKEDEGIKAAVYVKIVDEETNQLIPQKGVSFELYQKKKLLELNTYYPDKIAFQEFETTKQGVFYLPEKIKEGKYYFRNLKTLKGYDLADDVSFKIDKAYDWPEPYVVTIPMAPARNKIRVHMKDGDTGENIEEGSFEIVAAENITTGDGTVRYKEGEVVGKITCDKDGYGESKKLYLGHYLLRQKKVPQYYAGMKDTKEVTVEEKTEADSKLQEIAANKTSITLKLTDELYTNQPLEGVRFKVIGEGDEKNSKTFVTDGNGTISLTDLKKDTKYQFIQEDTKDGYQIQKDSYTVTVDKKGWIDQKTQKEIKATNRRLRMAIRVEDALMGKPVSGARIALYDSQKKQIKTWTSNQSETVLEDLKEGSYYLILDEKKSDQYEFQMKNQKEMQEFIIRIWTLKDFGILIGAGAVFLGVMALFVYIFKRVGKGKRQGGKDHEQ